MHAAMTMAALTMWGVGFGWQPMGGGGFEYMVRIEPHTIAALVDGEDIISELPPNLRDVRKIRITISDFPVPNEGRALPTMPPTASTGNGGPLNPYDNSSSPPPNAANLPPTITGGQTTVPDPYAQPPRTTGFPTAESPAGTSIRGPLPGRDSETQNVVTASAAATPDSDLLISPITLFLSIGGNIFLSWIIWSQRERYRMLLDDRAGAGVGALA